MKFYTEIILNRLIAITKALTTIDSPKCFVGDVGGLLSTADDNIDRLLPAVIFTPKTADPTQRQTKIKQSYKVTAYHVKRYDPSTDYQQDMIAKTSLIAQAIYNSGPLRLAGARLTWSDDTNSVVMGVAVGIEYDVTLADMFRELMMDILIHAVNITVDADSDA